jgi:hypothetical protein
MINYLKYLEESSNNLSFISLDTILYEFKEFHIYVKLKFNLGSEEDEDEYLDYFNEVGSDVDLDNLPSYFNDFIISELAFTDVEYLGYRKENDNINYSICFSMYRLVSVINECFDNNESFIYNLDLNYGYDEEGYGFSEGDQNYIFKIFVSESKIKEILPHVINEYERPKIQLPKFYNKDYISNKPIEQSNDIYIVTTNTKVRRLGYFKLLGDFFRIEGKSTINKINNKFENFLVRKNIIQDLALYRNNKGGIQKTKSGISGKLYIDVALDFNFIKKVSKILSIGKDYKVYHVLREEYPELDYNSNNIFSLNFIDKLFFTEEILQNDFLYISVLIELVYINGETSFSELKKVFQKRLVLRLNEYLFKFGLNEKNKREIVIIRNRINSWTKPVVYLEHVLMPRINWLYDLEIIEQNNNWIKLSEKGRKLFFNFCIWSDLEGGRVINPKEFINKFIQMTYFYVNNLETDFITNEEYINPYIDDYINLSFEKFKTLAPNRATLSQVIKYVKYKILIEHQIPVDYKYIEDYIKYSAKDKYIYKYQNQYKDGYIQMK